MTAGGRSSGVLLHVSSLPGPHGVGDLGEDAFRFAAFLRDARQSWWQMFPLGPPGVSNSPYQVLSAFAGNPLFISLEKMAEQGLLDDRDLKLVGESFAKTNYAAAWRFKKPRFRKAFLRFSNSPSAKQAAFDAFCREQAGWLDDYALYCALKEKYRGASWETWPAGYRSRDPGALNYAGAAYQLTVRYHQFLQFQFFTQWGALKDACHKRGIRLIGDLPIFVAHDSADVWANQSLFQLDRRGKPEAVAGVPPDYFSRTGQRWGNPLYKWDTLKRTGYKWWVRRFASTFSLFDALRIDHFIGFHNYWRIPASHKTAQRGKWVPGPGSHFFETLFQRLGRLDLIAEDLGAVTPEVGALRDKFLFPGMRVLQFGFSGEPSNPFLPHNYPMNTIVYTGTHDNDTTAGWFKHLDAATRERVLDYTGTDGKEISWDFIRLALSSVAKTAIVPAQDLLSLDSKSRMNMPGTANGNWIWRMSKNVLTPRIASRLAKLTVLYGRHDGK